MMTSMTTVTIPKVQISLDQLVTTIRELEPAARSEIARALVDAEMDARLADLIKSLAGRAPVNDITDADILAEVDTVRRASRR